MTPIERPWNDATRLPEGPASWRLAALGLGSLFAIGIAYSVFWMWPLRSADSWDLRWFVRTTAAGAVLSLPALMAAVGVIAPGRIGVRLLISASLAVLLGYALIVGHWRGEHRSVPTHEVVSAVMSYVAFLLPAFAVKKLRRWTIVPAAPAVQLRHQQYSVAGIMLATACVAAVLGVGRWVLPLTRWPSWDGPWLNQWMATAILASLIAWSCLPFLPLTALVLGTKRRLYSLFLTVLAIAAVFLGLYFVLQRINGVKGMQHFAVLIFGAYVSGLAYLLMIRASGFRLVREFRHQL